MVCQDKNTRPHVNGAKHASQQDGGGVEPALIDVAADRVQLVALLFRLDELREHGHAQGIGQLRDAADDLAAVGVVESAHERAVKLDDVEQIVAEMAVDYGTYGAEAADRINALLKELSAADPGVGTRWKTIMELWTSGRLGEPLHYGVLPDGLPETDELCIVVLGFQLDPDGTMKEELIERLTVALNSAKKYPNAYVVCTGGGTAAENPSASEAGEMAKWLLEQGVAESRIIIEDHSVTTAQNAIFTYDILTSLYPSVKKLAIVSSDYHIATGELLFSAESILRANVPGNEKLEVVSNAAWKAPAGTLSAMFQAGALIELSGDTETAFAIYYDNYDIHDLPPLH